MFETLFGWEMPLAARFFIAFLIVLALIGLTAWLVRRFGSNHLGVAARGRQPRLAVIDAATVDGRRRLVLIRRDNIEHLLMIGGPTDLVVEPNIVRAVGAREPVRAAAAEPAVRPSPAVENGWPLQPAGEPTPVPASRPYSSTATDEPWLPPEPGARARPAESLTGLAAELSTRLSPPDHGSPVAATEPAPRVPPMAEPAAPTADHSLAEMAQQLEAALRRAPAPEGRPPVTDPLARRLGATSGNITARAPAHKLKAPFEPKFEAKPETRVEAKSEPKFDAKPEPREPAATPRKNLYESLEEEMASLLNRPPGKS
jgi:flagellar protein FliO/FliZ